MLGECRVQRARPGLRCSGDHEVGQWGSRSAATWAPYVVQSLVTYIRYRRCRHPLTIVSADASTGGRRVPRCWCACRSRPTGCRRPRRARVRRRRRHRATGPSGPAGRTSTCPSYRFDAPAGRGDRDDAAPPRGADPHRGLRPLPARSATGSLLCNAAGVHDAATSELAVGLMIAAQRDFSSVYEGMRRHTWDAGDDLVARRQAGARDRGREHRAGACAGGSTGSSAMSPWSVERLATVCARSPTCRRCFRSPTSSCCWCP